MRHEGFWLTAPDHTDLHINRWCGTSAPKAVVMIAHGMAEHSLRYARFAESLTSHTISTTTATVKPIIISQPNNMPPHPRPQLYPIIMYVSFRSNSCLQATTHM